MRTEPITTDDIMSWGPCPDWTRERVAAYVGKGMTVPEFLAASGLTPIELDWVLNRREVFTDAELRRIVAALLRAEIALNARRPPDAEPPGTPGRETRRPEFPAPLIAALNEWPDPVGALRTARRHDPELVIAALRLVVEDAA